MTQHDPSKRRFIKAATYVAPAILTLSVTPAAFSSGSGRWNGHPNNPGEEPGNGDHPEVGNGDSGGADNSVAGNPLSSSHVFVWRKKRRWYWPFS